MIPVSLFYSTLPLFFYSTFTLHRNQFTVTNTADSKRTGSEVMSMPMWTSPLHQFVGPEGSPMSPVPGYSPLKYLASGAYGTVYRSSSLSSGAPVAIKRLDPDPHEAMVMGASKTLVREIGILKDIRGHENVVQLIEHWGTESGVLFLVFECAAGDLKGLMGGTMLPPAEVRSFHEQLLRGLAHAHGLGVVHRDIKPANLLISGAGVLKIRDFGLARMVQGCGRPYTNEVVTLWYRAPELLLGADVYAAEIDVWSAGTVFYEMATGKAMFPGTSQIDQLFRIFKSRGTPIVGSLLSLPHMQVTFPKFEGTGLVVDAVLDSDGEGLLDRLVTVDPQDRPTAKESLSSPYFTGTEN